MDNKIINALAEEFKSVFEKIDTKQLRADSQYEHSLLNRLATIGYNKIRQYQKTNNIYMVYSNYPAKIYVLANSIGNAEQKIIEYFKQNKSLLNIDELDIKAIELQEINNVQTNKSFYSQDIIIT